MISFLLSIHAVEFALGAMILWTARGSLRLTGSLYTLLVVVHLALQHHIPGGSVDRFFDSVLLALGTFLLSYIVSVSWRRVERENA